MIEDLPAITWRGLRVPWQDFATDLKQGIVQHKYPGVAGARLESVGREPLSITGRAMFSAGLIFEPKTYAKPLYPDVHKAFLKACADTSTGILVHPTWGRLKVKCESVKSSLSSQARGGEAVDVTFLEDTEDDQITTKQAPLAAAVTMAAELDAGLTALKAKFDHLRIPSGPSFEEMMRSIQGIADKATLLQKQIGGKIDSVHYRLNAVRDSIVRLRHASASNVRSLVEKTQAAVYEVQRTILVIAPTIRSVTGADMTIGEVCRSYTMKVAEFIKLNPSLARKLIIPAGTTIVRYAV